MNVDVVRIYSHGLIEILDMPHLVQAEENKANDKLKVSFFYISLIKIHQDHRNMIGKRVSITDPM